MNPMLAGRAHKPRVETWASVGAAAGCVVGGVAGLIIGLGANPGTAWFAVFEVGVPAAIVGGLVGLAARLIVTAARRAMRSQPPRA